jgi:hypothetical protein
VASLFDRAESRLGEFGLECVDFLGRYRLGWRGGRLLELLLLGRTVLDGNRRVVNLVGAAFLLGSDNRFDVNYGDLGSR